MATSTCIARIQQQPRLAFSLDHYHHSPQRPIYGSGETGSYRPWQQPSLATKIPELRYWVPGEWVRLRPHYMLYGTKLCYGDRAFFVACDAATSTQLLASRILQIIGVSAGPGENLVTAMHLALKCAPPTLLLLDNFESLWEAEKHHTATRDLLQKIADSPSSTLIVTMRATTPPPGILWTLFESLPPLAASSAKDVFLAINSTFCDGSDDGNEVLNELLMELDYVPLAIHLLAHVSADLSPRMVLKQWQKQRTRMLSLDSYTTDKLESVDVSISLSMESLDVSRHSGAIQLLGMLCLLPDGLLRWQERSEVIEESFQTATSDLFLLRKFALVYTTGAKLGVLSPIHHFVLQLLKRSL
ncbi:hypothetical protein FIBSPDRAFT_968543 [Athelia psychrophila]|uniref:ATPase AAA-type core domain-containing protein n=1 Tax=Athelia psychrophila TaxID=1759441 RepID=A0A167UHF1_9AGAM|nr:hypothetical protein FIBSPDRAFT_968543 [Fibularhizoctonia sp. CBS 109695]